MVNILKYMYTNIFMIMIFYHNLNFAFVMYIINFYGRNIPLWHAKNSKLGEMWFEKIDW